MNWLEALILGLIQGLTEFLPVSSSGHLEIGKVILGVNAERSLLFTVVVHGATVLSTIIVFRKDILELLRGVIRIQWNKETIYVSKIAWSMIPVLFVGVFFAEEVESFFTGNLLLVGSMLVITALLLTFAHYRKRAEREITFTDAFIIGIAQAFAVIPGISRSGATISAGLLMKNNKNDIARFSFLMVLAPIMGANIKDVMEEDFSQSNGIGLLSLLVGFLAAFFSGWIACKAMVGIVKKGKLIHFAIYCALVGAIAVLYTLLS
ncbi:MAG: undecaprenyl-diphosphate phosphatase [Bacteroidales bacterium]|nr:undecaprenyl-diphosphate phosphatase [Bacteroidales bacterium]